MPRARMSKPISMVRTCRCQSCDTSVRCASALVDDGVEVVAHSSIWDFAVKVQIDVVGLAASPNRGDDWQCKGIAPGLVLVRAGLRYMLLLGIASGDLFELANLGLQARLCVHVGLQEAGVDGRLVSAQAGLLVDNELRHQSRLGDAGVGVLDQIDCRVGSADLPVESACNHQQRNDGQQKDLAENAY